MADRLFAKMDANLDSNAKIMRAGRLGREVFLFVLRRNRVHGAKGWIPSLELEPWYLERTLWMPAREAEQGVTDCVTAELLVFSPPRASIVGWNEEWSGAMTPAERKALQRDRERDSRVTVTTSHESHERSEEIRGEEKRSEISEARAKRRPNKTGLPEGWKPNETHARIAQERRRDMVREAEEFRGKAIANGYRYADWDQAFCNWLRNDNYRPSPRGLFAAGSAEPVRQIRTLKP